MYAARIYKQKNSPVFTRLSRVSYYSATLRT